MASLKRSVEVSEKTVSDKLSRFQIEDEDFAAGCFGKVMLARDTLDNEVVIKKIPKSHNNVAEVANEVLAGRMLYHSNIAQFKDHFSNSEFDFLIFERVHGEDIFSLIEKKNFVPYSDHEGRNIFKQILKAVTHCHKQQIVHRDLKLENLLMDASGKVTVIDFGLCDHVQRGSLSERFCGSLDYVAPEVLSRRSYDGYKADTYSLGIVLFTLLFAEFPFVSKDRIRSIQQFAPHPTINYGVQRLRRWNVSEAAKDLINKMLDPNPAKRISLDAVKMHPWIQNPSC